MEKQVLVVDDDASVRDTLTRILMKSGFRVQAADSGAMCLDILKKGFSGLVLMDVIMPEMDGWETIQQIVEQGYTDQVIICMLTGKTEPDKKLDYLKEYVMDYFRKPFETDMLVKMVNQYLSYIQ